MGKVTSPCCCNLQIGTFAVAIFNIVCSLIGLVYYIVVLVVGAGIAFIELTKNGNTLAEHINSYNENDDIRDPNSPGSLILVGIVALVVTVFIILGFLANLLTGILLFIGARARNEGKCKLWFLITAIFFVIYVLYKICIIGMLIWAQPEEGVVRFTAEIISLFICVLIECYQLCVVYAFIEEVRRHKGRDQIRTDVVYTPAPKRDDR